MGVDPGTQVVGYGFVVVSPSGPRLLAAGVVRAAARAPIAQRLARIQAQIEALLERFLPTTVAVESAFAAQNVRSALRIGEGRGVILASAAQRGLGVSEYPPAVVKKAVVGNGVASKEQVARMVEATLGQAPLGLALDATDALAVALTHIYRGLRPALDAARRAGTPLDIDSISRS